MWKKEVFKNIRSCTTSDVFYLQELLLCPATYTIFLSDCSYAGLYVHLSL